MSMYATFKTDNNLEKTGIILNYGSFQIRIRRAGGSNNQYQQLLETKMKPHRRAISGGEYDRELMVSIMREVFAKTVICDWQTKVNDELVQGIEGEDGSLLPYTVENVIATFKALPDLFSDVQEQASASSMYKLAILEADSKN